MIPVFLLRLRVLPLRRQRRPAKAHADRDDDYRKCRADCWARGIPPRIACRGIESKDRLGGQRWVVERILVWLNRQRRRLIRFDRLASQYLGFLHLGCALACWSDLTKMQNAH